MRQAAENEKRSPEEKIEYKTSPYATRQNDSMIGRVLDNRFLIDKNLTAPEIGAEEGGIGIVYLAQDLKLMNKKVVIKILRRSIVSQAPDLLRKFMHEKEALVRLDHPNIVRILDSGTLADGSPYLVMQYLAGYSLRRLLKEKEILPVEQSLKIIEAVTEALGAAHAEGILHRDIKPENVMITPRGEGTGQVRLIDFGIARVLNSQIAPETRVEGCKGTVLYMAPEQLRGEISQTPASDIYSCTVMIHEMLTGRHPFQPQSLYEMLQLQYEGLKTAPSTYNRAIPPEADRLMIKALSFAPEDRPQDILSYGRELAVAFRRRQSREDAGISGKAVYPLINVSDPEKAAEKTHSGNVPPSSTENQKVETGSAGFKATDPVSVQTPVSPMPPPVPGVGAPDKRSDRSIKRVYALGAAFVIVVLGLIAGLWWMKHGGTDSSAAAPDAAGISDAAVASEPVHRLTYRILIQNRSSGSENNTSPALDKRVFDSRNDSFKLLLKPETTGYLYVFNEGKNNRGDIDFSILYPTPKRQNGSPRVTASQSVETGQNSFITKGGTETIWIVWTAAPQGIVENARRTAFDGRGIIKDTQTADALRRFLNDNRNDKEIKHELDERMNTLEWNGDTLSYAFNIEHRW